MDDGSIQNKGLHLNVYGFSFDEVINLKNTLETLFLSLAFCFYSFFLLCFAPKEATENKNKNKSKS